MRILQFPIALVLAMILLVIALTGCPQKSGIDKAAKASLQLSNLTRDAIAATRKAYEDHLINLDTKDKMATQLDKLIAGGTAFNAAVEQANAQYKTSGTVPQSTLQMLNTLLTERVTGPFLAFLQALGAISTQQAPYLASAITALRTALLLIGSFVSERTVKLLDNVANYATASVYENKIALGGNRTYVRKLC